MVIFTASIRLKLLFCDIEVTDSNRGNNLLVRLRTSYRKMIRLFPGSREPSALSFAASTDVFAFLVLYHENCCEYSFLIHRSKRILFTQVHRVHVFKSWNTKCRSFSKCSVRVFCIHVSPCCIMIVLYFLFKVEI